MSLIDTEFLTFEIFAKNFNLNTELMASIQKMNYQTPTPMQKLAIPEILNGKDVIVEAQTGSGKTACFVIPILEKLYHEENSLIEALILSPTRELAIQTADNIKKLSQAYKNPIKVMTIIGGERFVEQEEKIKNGVNIVVATPGRLIDLLEKNLLDLKSLKFLVLDEADKLLDQGFALELDNLLSQFNEKRQNLFFSATYPEKIEALVSKISKNSIHLKIEEEAIVVERIKQRVILVNRDNRGLLLRHLIKTENIKNAIVFVASQTQARNLTVKLQKLGVKATAIYGDLTQNERNKALSDFKSKKVDFLVATDIAARGIDIVKLDFVINFDLPRSPADYVHRIGRTARAQEVGEAISFIGHEDQEHFKLIEKRANINLARESIVGFELTGEAPVKVKGQAPVKGKRKSKKDKARELALRR